MRGRDESSETSATTRVRQIWSCKAKGASQRKEEGSGHARQKGPTREEVERRAEPEIGAGTSFSPSGEQQSRGVGEQTRGDSAQSCQIRGGR